MKTLHWLSLLLFSKIIHRGGGGMTRGGGGRSAGNGGSGGDFEPFIPIIFGGLAAIAIGIKGCEACNTPRKTYSEYSPIEKEVSIGNIAAKILKSRTAYWPCNQ